MAARPVRFHLAVDHRTNDLTPEALKCRAQGHKWREQTVGKKRFLELVKLGQYEEAFSCDNDCGATQRQIIDIRSGRVVQRHRTYPAGGEYLLPAGTGRLSRDDARVAKFARFYPEYA